jgi:hypothetical protein
VSACRAAGPELSSILTFTLELLPSAVIGALLGGLAVQGLGVLLRYRGCAARVSLAAHAGCTLGMAGGMLLCTLVTPSPALLIAEAMLAACAAAMLTWNMARKAPAASVAPPAHMLTSAQ